MATSPPFLIITGVLAAAVATSGTVVIAYPTGYTSASAWGTAHVLMLGGNDQYLAGAGVFSLAFAGSITLTNLGAGTWAAGTAYTLQVDLTDQAAVTGRQKAAIVSLTDNSGGTAGDTIVDVPGTYTEATSANQFASLTAKVNLILAALREYGIIAT